MMQAVADFHFLRPGWLLAMPAAIGVWWLWSRRADALRGWREQMDPDLLQALIVGPAGRQDRGVLWLLVAWLLAALAIAGPTWRPEPNPFADDAQPLLVLLKASQSMQLPPPQPSRMERAQLKIADLAKARPGQPLGLIAYAGSAHLVLPPTRDTEIVAQMASEISPEIMPTQGDRLDIAIQTASELLDDLHQGGALLVVADSAEIDSRSLATDQTKAGYPVEILALTGKDTPETQSLRDVGRSLGAKVEPLTPDDHDIAAIVDFAERRVASGMVGDSTRWQEAGYWLTPILALMVACSFRRQETRTGETRA